MNAGDNKTCTVTNTRKTATVKLVKDLSPTNDPGRFNLTVNGQTTNNAGNGGFAQATVDAGATVNLSETGGATPATSLANYTSTLDCNGGITLSNNTGASGSFTLPASAANTTITCTVHNTRKTVTVKLVKDLNPTNDAGRFNLTVNSQTTNNAGNTDFTQATVNAGDTANLSETGGATPATSLTNYNSTLDCDSGITVSNNTGISGSFTVPPSAANTTITCTLHNTRKTRSLTLTKVLVPANDGGKFNLTINDGTAQTALDQINGGSVQKNVIAGVSVTVSESAGTGTSLANYHKVLSCTAGGQSVASGTDSATFNMPDDDVTCTATNTRPLLSVAKSCTTSLSTSFAVTVNYSGSICNQGTLALQSIGATDVQTLTGGGTASGGTVTLDPAGPTTLAACPTPGSCTIANNPTSCRGFTGSYNPTGPSSGNSACTYLFSDKLTASASTVSQGVAVSAEGPANCPLCSCSN